MLVPEIQCTIIAPSIAGHWSKLIDAFKLETLGVFLFGQEVIKNLACLVILKELFGVELIEFEEDLILVAGRMSFDIFFDITKNLSQNCWRHEAVDHVNLFELLLFFHPVTNVGH